MAALSACPLCRADLERLGGTNADRQAVEQCPDCGADLSRYNDIADRGRRLAELAHELLSRGQAAGARLAIDQLSKLLPAAELDLTPLKARLALMEGETEAAEHYAAQLDAGEADQVREQLRYRKSSRLRARELFNYALTSARRGAYREAAGLLMRAVVHDPRDPRIWTLKLKVDLCERRINECYRDLAALDELAARPPEYFQLEQLLPPLARA